MIKMWSEDEGNDFRCVETLFSSSAVQRCLPQGDAKVILGTNEREVGVAYFCSGEKLHLARIPLSVGLRVNKVNFRVNVKY